MEEYSKNAWEEIVGRCEEVGVDGFEINFSCPHGMPERRMGADLTATVIEFVASNSWLWSADTLHSHTRSV
jgi:dihydroorotate dehydrogenase